MAKVASQDNVMQLSTIFGLMDVILDMPNPSYCGSNPVKMHPFGAIFIL